MQTSVFHVKSDPSHGNLYMAKDDVCVQRKSYNIAIHNF